MRSFRSIAVDLGAESCRVSLGEWDGSTVRLRLIHRYPNGPVERDGRIRWDLDRLLTGLDEGLRLAAEHVGSAPIDSIGVDGWAVDYVRLDSAGKPLGPPFCYRDRRTETIMPDVWKLMAPDSAPGDVEAGKAALYHLTGIQLIRLNTLYQLYADRREGLAPGVQWLNIPEYCLHRLGGRAVAEYSNATHTQLVNVRTRDWCDEVFAKVGLDRSAAAPIVPTGTPVGRLTGPLASLPALGGAELIAPACHDTGAAVAAIPDSGPDSAFLSSGTWSLVGAVLNEPCTSDAALRVNFTNEGGVGGRLRFLKNVNGMWLIEECLRQWNAEGVAAGGRKLTAADLVAGCQDRPQTDATFFVDEPDLLLPGRMPERINRLLEQTGHTPIAAGSEQPAAMAHCIFLSLAKRYAELLRALEEVTGRHIRKLYVVGGGSQNQYLNRLIEQQTGYQVIRGAVEGSTVGNLAIQFATLESGGGPATPEAVALWASRFLAAESEAKAKTTG